MSEHELDPTSENGFSRSYRLLIELARRRSLQEGVTMINKTPDPKVEKAVIAVLRVLARRGREVRLQRKAGQAPKA
jgi:hypothetical protein